MERTRDGRHRTLRLLGMTALLSASAHATGLEERDPGIARALLSRASSASSVFCLWRASGYGSERWEAAGWVLKDSGELSVASWPITRNAYHQRWNGPVPAGAIGILHTHPAAADPRPSEDDVVTAHTLGIPVAAVSRKGIFTAFPDGRIVREVDGGWYALPARGAPRCR